MTKTLICGTLIKNRGALNKTLFITVLIFCVIPIGVNAQIYKCKNADGEVGYSDRPCSGSEVSSTPMEKTISENSGQSKAKEIGKEFQGRWSDWYSVMDKHLRECQAGDEKACNEYKRVKEEYFRTSRGDFQQTLQSMLSEQFRACKAGNRKACEESECASMGSAGWTETWARRPVEDFIACAKGLGLPFGSYWAIASGKPDFNSMPDQYYINKMDDGTQWKNTLAMTCFRKKVSAYEFKGISHRIVEIVSVSKTETGAKLTFTFSPKIETWNGEGASPEYRTLEELASHLCER